MKNLLKTFACILIVTFTSCEVQEQAVQKDQHSQIVMKSKPFDELILNTNFNSSFNKLRQNNNRMAVYTDPKSAIEAQYDFKISETPVKIIEVNNKTSYTIAITRDNQTENYFENLIIEVDSLNHTKAFINKYTPTQPTSITPEGKVRFNGSVESKSIQLNSGEPSCDVYCQTYVGNLCNDIGANYCGGTICGYYVETICTGGGGSSSGGFGTTGTGSSTGTGGYGSGSGGGGNGGSNNQGADPNTWNPIRPAVPPDNIATGINLSDIDLNTPLITNQFYNQLTTQQQQYLNTHNPIYKAIKQYLIQNISYQNGQLLISSSAVAFANEVLNTSDLLNINAMQVWNDEYDNFRNGMSISERQLFDNLLPNRKMWYMVSAKKAFDKANELFPNTPTTPNNLHNGRGDAYRHALWNALSAGFFGSSLAEDLTTAHENQPSQYTFNYMEKEMDLFNNNKGRIISSYSNFTNIYANVLSYLQLGGLRYLNNLDTNGLATNMSTLIPTN
jgi:uncharacterized membrane protein YgcG